MKSLIIYTAILTGFLQYTYGQVDSLKRELDKNKPVAARIEDLHELSWELSINNPDEALVYAFQSLQLSLQVKDIKAEATSYNRIGLAFDIKTYYDSAIYFYEKSYRNRLSIADTAGAANVLLNIGAAYYTKGFYNLALTYYLDCAKLIENSSAGNNKTLSKVYNNIGLIHRVKKEYDEALQWYFKSLALKKLLEDETGILNSYINIALVYQNQRQIVQAESYTDSTLTIIRKHAIESEYSTYYINKASILREKKEYKTALDLLNKALVWLQKHHDEHTLVYAYSQFGEVYIGMKDYENAIIYLKKTILVANQIQRRELLRSAYELIAGCYEKTGNYREAYFAGEQYKMISDSIFNLESRRSLNEQQIIYNVKKSEEQIALLNSENEKKALAISQTKQRALFISLLLIISVIGAVILGYALRSNKKNNRILESKNEQINRSLKEKEVLLREIHHRVKNNLQIINGLLDLQESLQQDKTMGSQVAEAQGRIKTMSLIHEMLYQNENIANISLDNYVQRLVSSIENGYDTGKNNVIKKYNLSNVHFHIDTIIPLGLIINELVANAFKYVFTKDKGNQLQISVKELQQGNWQLEIKDDGPGIANNGAGDREGSFGLRLVKMLCRQLKGNVEYRFNNGSHFFINFSTETQAA